MTKPGHKDSGKNHKRRPPRADKAAAMREAVRKAIESLIDKKGPAKSHPRGC